MTRIRRWGTMLKYGSEGSKYFITSQILPKDIAVAHMNGDIHIHDMDFYMLTETCCQIDLLKLFHNGFSTGHGYLREPNRYPLLCCARLHRYSGEPERNARRTGCADCLITAWLRALPRRTANSITRRSVIISTL